jgi:hypothetical protein
MGLWMLVSEWTFDDDGNSNVIEHGVFSEPYRAAEWLKESRELDGCRTYYIHEWEIDNPEFQGVYYYRLVSKYGTWDKVYTTGRIENNAQPETAQESS